MLCKMFILWCIESKLQIALNCLRDKDNEILCPMWKKNVVIAQKQEKVIWHQNDKSKKKTNCQKCVFLVPMQKKLATEHMCAAN